MISPFSLLIPICPWFERALWSANGKILPRLGLKEDILLFCKPVLPTSQFLSLTGTLAVSLKSHHHDLGWKLPAQCPSLWCPLPFIQKDSGDFLTVERLRNSLLFCHLRFNMFRVLNFFSLPLLKSACRLNFVSQYYQGSTDSGLKSWSLLFILFSHYLLPLNAL